MPPRPSLVLNVQPQEETRHLEASLRHDDLGGVNILTKSWSNYSFTSEGMMRNGACTTHCNVREKDIRIIKTLGRGASSTVFKGFHYTKNKFVAVKKISIYEKETRQQMMNDVKALVDAKLAPNLVEFLGAFHTPETGQISIVLEYMEGGSLADLLVKVGRIPEDLLSKITAKVLHGLVYLHKERHMVHRDIKPANILLNMEGEPKITDFGISAFVDCTLAMCHTFTGTVTYMSPERINNEAYGSAADIWSLGLVLIECAIGRYPYNANVGPLELMIQVVGDDPPLPPVGAFSEEFRDFVRCCLHKDPHQRPTAEQLLKHAYLTKTDHATLDVRSFVRVMFDAQEKMDEIATVFAWNYYALLSGGTETLPHLAPLYSEASVLTYEGEVVRGRKPIIQKLCDMAKLQSAFGRVVHRVDHVDCQQMDKEGTALVLIKGCILVEGKAGGAPSPFSEAFVLSQALPGEYYVSSQLFRLQR